MTPLFPTLPGINFLCAYEDTSLSSSRSPSVSPTPLDSSVLYTIPVTHTQNISGLISINDSFISSSMDGSTKYWNAKTGDLQRSVFAAGTKNPYLYSMTALATLNQNQWISARRDFTLTVSDFNLRSGGRQIGLRAHHRYECKVETWLRNEVSSMNQSGSSECIAGSNPGFKQSTSISWKHLLTIPSQTLTWNLSPISTIVGRTEEPECTSFFVGQGPQFSLVTVKGRLLYTVNTKKTISTLLPLSDDKMLISTGPTLSMWERNTKWEPSFKLISPPSSKDPEDYYLSSVISLEHHTNFVAVSVFDGSVRLLDVDRGVEASRWYGKKERVWSIINCQEDVIASSSDDRYVRLWDVRSKDSIFTIGTHSAPVTKLLNLKENVFLSATCSSPSLPSEGPEFICREVRML